MPTFYKTTEVETEIDISVEDFYYEMYSEDEQEMLDLIGVDGYTTKIGGRGYNAGEFGKAIQKLTEYYHCLPKEDIEKIIEIASRL